MGDKKKVHVRVVADIELSLLDNLSETEMLKKYWSIGLDSEELCRFLSNQERLMDIIVNDKEFFERFTKKWALYYLGVFLEENGYEEVFGCGDIQDAKELGTKITSEEAERRVFFDELTTLLEDIVFDAGKVKSINYEILSA